MIPASDRFRKRAPVAVVMTLLWGAPAARGEGIKPFIIHPTGTVRDHQFDDVVAVGDQAAFVCTGVMVGRRHVLTARHCRQATRIAFGNAVDGKARIVAVRAALAPGDPRADVQLLELAAPQDIALHDWHRPATERSPFGALRMMGFGATDAAGRAGYGAKRFTDVRVAGWGCESERVRTLGCVPGLEMVIGRFGGRDTCSGDSGGPVFEAAVGPDGTLDFRRIVAITSRAFPSAGERCGAGGIYTRIDAIASWISSVVSKAEEGSKR